MAERSFAGEVKKLHLGDGEVFRGEGILAITKALLENGVSYVTGYQGSPISHLMDVLADAEEILDEYGVTFTASASEAAAAAALAASVHYPMRGATTFKGPVGVNVASDALANLSSGGVTGGALVIVGEDYGEGSSIMQERSHAFAMKSHMWLLDPRPNLPSLVDTVGHGFELSEASNTPVMMIMRIRSCHVTGEFIASDNKRPVMTPKEAVTNPHRETSRVVLPPSSFLHEQEKMNTRLPAAINYIKDNKLNEFFGPDQAKIGLVIQGSMYNGVLRALQRLGLANAFGDTDVPLYVMNVAWPVIEDEFLEFCDGKDAVLVVEEGNPGFTEDVLGRILHRKDAPTKLFGKDPFPLAGELTGEVMYDGIQSFLKSSAPDMLPSIGANPNKPPVQDSIADLADTVPVRPPGFCVGCPERPIFAATKLVENELGPHHISSDIGCHVFSINEPFNIGGTTMGYGLGPASNSAFGRDQGDRRSISFIGDGGFWHNGLTSSIGNAVFNKNDSVTVIVDNYYSAATGGQDVLSSRASNDTKSTKHPITEAVKGIGVDWVRHIDHTYDVNKMRDTLTEALTTPEKGPKVIVASSECMLNRQRREKPAFRKAVSGGERVIKQRFGVDEDVCTGDHACMRLSGCPSLSVKDLNDPLRDDPVAAIDQNCVGCGNCGEVADAAVLCPSFYRADIIHNPGKAETWMHQAKRRIIGWFQTRREQGRLTFQER